MRLASEKSFIGVIVVVVVVVVAVSLLLLCGQNFVDFQSSQQQALEEVPSNLEVKCRRVERYCFPMFSFLSLSLSLFFMKGETTQEHPEDFFQE